MTMPLYQRKAIPPPSIVKERTNMDSVNKSAIRAAWASALAAIIAVPLSILSLYLNIDDRLTASEEKLKLEIIRAIICLEQAVHIPAGIFFSRSGTDMNHG